LLIYFAFLCNNELVETTDLLHSTLERIKRTWWSLLVDCATYLYTISICLYVCLSNYQSFQKVPLCDLSCDLILSYLISHSIFRMPCPIHLRIVLIFPIPLVILFLVWAGNLWHFEPFEEYLQQSQISKWPFVILFLLSIFRTDLHN